MGFYIKRADVLSAMQNELHFKFPTVFNKTLVDSFGQNRFKNNYINYTKSLFWNTNWNYKTYTTPAEYTPMLKFASEKINTYLWR